MEIEVKAYPWNAVNIDEIAQLLLLARRASPFWNPTLDLDWFRRFIDHRKERFSPSFVILARSGERLLGMVSIINEDPALYELWRWHPIMLPGENETEIAISLIKNSINHLKAAGIQSLEVCLDFSNDEITPETKAYYLKYKSWYELCGAVKLDEYAYMTCKTSDFNPTKQIFSLDGFETETFRTQDKDKAYNCFYQAFLGGKDRSFLGKTIEQRRRMFNKYFDDPENLNEEGSMIMSKKDQVIGFSVIKTRPIVGDEHLALLCVHPDYQGKGMGKQLLAFSMSKIAQQGDQLVSLGVDLENVAAYQLYHSSGFEIQTKLITHVWKNEEIS